jgi:hypothetical protein
LRARDPAGSWNAALFGKRGGDGTVEFNLFSKKSPGGASAEIGFELTTAQGVARVSFPVSHIEAAAWHNLVGRYDGTSIEIFCDGRRMASKPWRGAIVANDGPVLIGAEMNASEPARHFRGEVEEAALWGRALSDQELANL